MKAQPARSRDSRQQSGAQIRRLRLLNLIWNWSRVKACVAMNATFAAALRCSESTVERDLRRLRTSGLVVIVTGNLKRNGPQKYRERTIYLVSGLDVDAGARRFVNLIAANGGRECAVTLAAEVACGQMRCTPAQMQTWSEAAVQRRWIQKVVLTTAWPGAVPRWRCAGEVPYTELPNQMDPRPVTLANSGSTSDDLDKALLALVDNSRCMGLLGQVSTVPLSNETVAKELKVSEATARRLVAAKVAAGELVQEGRGRGRCLFRERPQRRDRIADALTKLRESGPQPLTEMTKYMGKHARSDFLRALKAAGVHVTRFGNERIASLGELPPDFVANTRAEQRKRKRQKNKQSQRRRRFAQRQEAEEDDRKNLALATISDLLTKWAAEQNIPVATFTPDEVLATYSRYLVGGHLNAAHQAAGRVHQRHRERLFPEEAALAANLRETVARQQAEDEARRAARW